MTTFGTHTYYLCAQNAKLCCYGCNLHSPITASLLKRKSMEASEITKEKIIVSLHALNWTMGEVAFFDITLAGVT